MAEEIKDAFGIDAALTKGPSGTFKVVVNDVAVFSKSKQGRFPEKGEVVREIRKRQAEGTNHEL